MFRNRTFGEIFYPLDKKTYPVDLYCHPLQVFQNKVSHIASDIHYLYSDVYFQWRMGLGEIAVRVGYIRPPPFMGIKPDQNWMMMMRIKLKFFNDLSLKPDPEQCVN